jgi:hypothetical protein
MSVQKLRTPKGLAWLKSKLSKVNRDTVLASVVRLQELFSSIWAECVWQLADAKDTETKFIVSDHPVTIYNRELGPRNPTWCRGANDPDIRMAGSHTIFPLSLSRVLILTNLAWVRDPYQSAKRIRPNPRFLRDTVFNFTDIQTHRDLAEREVREINFIIKSRAYRYVAAAREESLFPEKSVSKSEWARFGDGYLLMPDPRSIHYGGEVIMGFKDGSTLAYDEYGRVPGQAGYGSGDLPSGSGPEPLYRFKGEFARKFGPRRRGRSFEGARLEPEVDSDDLHQYHLSLEVRKRSPARPPPSR